MFDKAEQQPNHRWVSLRNQLGLPHVITLQAIEQVAAFAEAELGALVLHGGVGLNTGLPLTDNQRARQQQLREIEKKRVAALGASKPAGPNPTQAEPSNANVSASEARTAGVRYTSTLSSWAKPCSPWTECGVCTRG